MAKKSVKTKKITNVKFEFTGIDHGGKYAGAEGDITANVDTSTDLDEAVKNFVDFVSSWGENTEIVKIYWVIITYSDGSIEEISDKAELNRLTELARNYL